MSSNQVEILIKEELRGRNALHFWIGVAIVFFGLHLWWNGYFTRFMLVFDIAPPVLKESFEARSNGFASSGMGSTGFLSLAFDTLCLIGWGGSVFFLLLRKALNGLIEVLSVLVAGALAWAKQTSAKPIEPTTAPTDSFQDKVLQAFKLLEAKIEESRLSIDEVKLQFEETKMELALLKQSQEVAPKPATTRRRKAT
jgi:hypothetical protein